MTTLSELTERIQRTLAAIGTDDQFDESVDIDLIVDGISAAHNAILPWVPKQSTATIAQGTETYTLPDDLYQIEAVYDPSTNENIGKLTFEPGDLRENRYWVRYPYGSITLNEETANDYTLYYLAHWSPITTQADLEGDLEPPDYCITPMVYYATAYVLLPQSVQTSSIRQFQTRVEAGHPEHNPLEKSVKFLLTLFQQEMDSFPKHQKARV